MKFTSFRTKKFRRLYENLPIEIQKLAYSNFQLWIINPFHPSLHFKKIGENWSVRIGLHYRAVGKFIDEGFLWEWIGTHAEYDKL